MRAVTRVWIPACAGMAFLLLATTAHARQMDDQGIAVLRMIDKLSARTSTFEVPVEKTVKFGSRLFIKVRACRKASPLDTPESAAFLQIWEKAPGAEESQWIFSGWMFASRSSASAMDHHVYDVWLIDCKKAATTEAPLSTEAAPSSAPAAGSGTPEKSKPGEQAEEKAGDKEEDTTKTEKAPSPGNEGGENEAGKEQKKVFDPAAIRRSLEDEEKGD